MKDSMKVLIKDSIMGWSDSMISLMCLIYYSIMGLMCYYERVNDGFDKRFNDGFDVFDRRFNHGFDVFNILFSYGFDVF